MNKNKWNRYGRNSLEVLICLGLLVLQALVSVVLLLIERGQADVVIEVRDEQHSADTRLRMVPSTQSKLNITCKQKEILFT